MQRSVWLSITLTQPGPKVKGLPAILREPLLSYLRFVLLIKSGGFIVGVVLKLIGIRGREIFGRSVKKSEAAGIGFYFYYT